MYLVHIDNHYESYTGPFTQFSTQNYPQMCLSVLLAFNFSGDDSWIKKASMPRSSINF